MRQDLVLDNRVEVERLLAGKTLLLAMNGHEVGLRIDAHILQERRNGQLSNGDESEPRGKRGPYKKRRGRPRKGHVDPTVRSLAAKRSFVRGQFSCRFCQHKPFAAPTARGSHEKAKHPEQWKKMKAAEQRKDDQA